MRGLSSILFMRSILLILSKRQVHPRAEFGGGQMADLRNSIAKLPVSRDRGP